MLLVNVDDFGWNKKITDKILTCFVEKRIHFASAMTFMADSERAAELAHETHLPVGLHLNLDEELTGLQAPEKLREHHQNTAAYLKARKWNQVLYNPLLRNSFDYVFQAQWDEFCRLYGATPKRLDGHRHMHLCMNILLSGKIPKGICVRRNFTFYSGEKNPINRLYRYLVDRWLQLHFICTDSFFCMTPLNRGKPLREKLQRPLLLSKSTNVEILFHPGIENEYSFLLSPEWLEIISHANESF